MIVIIACGVAAATRDAQGRGVQAGNGGQPGQFAYVERGDRVWAQPGPPIVAFRVPQARYQLQRGGRQPATDSWRGREFGPRYATPGVSILASGRMPNNDLHDGLPGAVGGLTDDTF